MQFQYVMPQWPDTQNEWSIWQSKEPLARLHCYTAGGLFMALILRFSVLSLMFSSLMFSSFAFAGDEGVEGGDSSEASIAPNAPQTAERAVVLFCQTNDYSIPTWVRGGYESEMNGPCVAYHPWESRLAKGKLVIVEKYELICTNFGSSCPAKSQNPLTLHKDCQCGEGAEGLHGIVELKH